MANRQLNSLSVNTSQTIVARKGLDSDWAQSQTRILIGFGTSQLREESQGLLFRSCKLGHFDFLMTQLSALGSLRMVKKEQVYLLIPLKML